MVLRRYRTNACHSCAIKNSCTKGKERRISRWEHEHIIEAVQRRLDEHPEKMRQRRETVEHPFASGSGWAVEFAASVVNDPEPTRAAQFCCDAQHRFFQRCGRV